VESIPKKEIKKKMKKVIEEIVLKRVHLEKEKKD
jgi:hypothetical protein